MTVARLSRRVSCITSTRILAWPSEQNDLALNDVVTELGSRRRPIGNERWGGGIVVGECVAIDCQFAGRIDIAFLADRHGGKYICGVRTLFDNIVAQNQRAAVRNVDLEACG